MKKVLITGASGLVGRHLTYFLQQKNYPIAHLGRNRYPLPLVESYTWNITKGEIEKEAFQKANIIVHLAGANVAQQRWTSERKKEILESRTKSTQLLYDVLKEGNHQVDTFISASAIGIYGNTGDNVATEKSAAANDFLAQVTVAWEKEVDKIATLGIRTLKLRIGVVFAKGDGALHKIAQPIKYFVGAPLGSGNQFISWIHIEDLCRMILFLMENETLSGVFNAVSPHPITNKDLTYTIAKVLHRPILLPNVPDFILKAMLGEMATVVLNSCRASADKILQAGFQFNHVDVVRAVKSLLR
ncbi:MAG: TIGR01777 family oxidoreductase [Flammeovirgaceae bacterium]|nr:TIGR01777 family oxidoreductase [Flammeovirgaceae bacterium]MDW8288884.1 TIGR01777 family oxidoreductase [Flammeovirgaceae bacterium]